jgi:uncharacterized membrane-anchored protein YitT (DUF2179 family)
VGGIAIIINHFTAWPVGLLYLILNIPMLIIGFFYLGGWRFLLSTLFAVVLFSVAADLFSAYLPTLLEVYPITDDMLLSAIYAGLVGGIGFGILYGTGSSPGGTAILGRIVQKRTGIPLSQLYLYIDGITIVVAGLVFGWEIALHAMLTLFLSGIASDFALEGPSMVRSVLIITDNAEELGQALMVGLNHGVSYWRITGGYTGQTRWLLLCTINRSQVSELRQIVAAVDPRAFVTIANAHQALGGGFMRLKT